MLIGIRFSMNLFIGTPAFPDEENMRKWLTDSCCRRAAVAILVWAGRTGVRRSSRKSLCTPPMITYVSKADVPNWRRSSAEVLLRTVFDAQDCA